MKLGKCQARGLGLGHSSASRTVEFLCHSGWLGVFLGSTFLVAQGKVESQGSQFRNEGLRRNPHLCSRAPAQTEEFIQQSAWAQACGDSDGVLLPGRSPDDVETQDKNNCTSAQSAVAGVWGPVRTEGVCKGESSALTAGWPPDSACGWRAGGQRGGPWRQPAGEGTGSAGRARR